jgi:hypothetical protein
MCLLLLDLNVLMMNFFSILWHRHLGYITRDRMERLTRNGILDSLDFSYFQSILDSLDFLDFQTCVDCVKGKIMRARKKGATRNKGFLEIIHIDTCEPFTSAILGGYKYFITFIDHFSCYGYILLIQEKSEALDMLKFYKVDIELKGEKEIKIVRSGRGGELYDGYGFKENIVDHCIYLKISGSKIICLVIYVDDILFC